MIKLQGGIVIGFILLKEKVKIVILVGVDYVFLYIEVWYMKVLEMINGIGVNVVYELVGFILGESFNVIKIGGIVVFYGMVGGNFVLVDLCMFMDILKILIGGDFWNVFIIFEECKK